jgi:hypothetical protein
VCRLVLNLKDVMHRNVVAFRVLTPCIVVCGYQYLGGMYCLHPLEPEDG